MTLNDQRLILDIEFMQGTNTYCVGQIQQAFAHLPPKTWKFYAVDGTRLTDITGVCHFDTFNLETLASYSLSPSELTYRIANGNAANGSLKKIYISPIAPQSFLIEEDDSDLSDEPVVLESNTDNTMLKRNPETPPSVSRTLA
jgi:hypothetical protein